VVAQELVHNMNKMTGKKGYFAIKVDLAKAYDMIHGTLFTIHLKRWVCLAVWLILLCIVSRR
jgi:hypothetical protein